MAIPWGQIVTAGASSLAGALTNRSKTTKSKSTTKRVLTPEQQGASTLIQDQFRKMIDNPTAGLAPFKTAAQGAVNRNYAALPGRLDASLASRGFSRGGQTSSGRRQIELSRQGDLAGVENQFAQQAIGERDKGLALAENFRNQVFEQQSEGEGTDPGNMLGGAVGGGLQTFVLLQQLQKMMAGKS